MRLTIGKKLGLGFTSILALMVASAMIVYASLANINHSVEVLSRCDQMLNGLNHSMAGLRGYFILGADQNQASFFKRERQEAWKNIDAGMAEISLYYQHATKADDVNNFGIVARELKSLREAQDYIEQVAHTTDNVPALNMLLQEAVPRANQVLDAITRMIDAEAANEASDERKQLLTNMAHFSRAFARCLADLRAYLLAGDIAYKIAYEKDWEENQKHFTAIDGQSETID